MAQNSVPTKGAIQFVGKDSKLLFTVFCQIENDKIGEHITCSPRTSSGAPDVISYPVQDALRRRGFRLDDDICHFTLGTLKEIRKDYLSIENIEPAELNAILGLVHNYSQSYGAPVEILFVFWSETIYSDERFTPQYPVHPDNDIAIMIYNFLCAMGGFLLKFGSICIGIIAVFYAIRAIIGLLS